MLGDEINHDNLHNPNSSYKRIKVCHYNDIDYYFEFCGIFYTVNEILSNADNASSCVFKFNPEFIVHEDGTEHQVYSEYYMGEWWHRAESKIPAAAKLLG
ncbi:hypothetical protein RclHR1_20830001 [Rhizophagus clarus]|uniref:Uncharacterized protein n=1 Tax=Rhizophagus clarus TaxID=94130 RepID=A0A2Z6QS98_9GLOM|nr:hypothetical protein RclHR1_20830001 [Rhizophagus clarus]GES98200.1 hypothetical protein GLOIN_2v1791678 [Rhizophagus clarus]